MKALRWILLACLSLSFSCPVLAESDVIRRQQVLALLPVLHSGQSDEACSQAMYQTLVRQNGYDLLPDWYVLEQLAHNPARWQNDWPGLFSRLKEADLAILNHLEELPPDATQPTPVSQWQLVGILLQKGPPAKILRSEVMTFAPGERVAGCEKMAHRLLGQPEAETFHSPALSATLSLLIPGAGHLYRGGFDGIAMGAGFLGAYLLMAYLGFSDTAAPTVTRSQWGGLLLLLTFADVVTAFFLADQ